MSETFHSHPAYQHYPHYQVGVMWDDGERTTAGLQILSSVASLLPACQLLDISAGRRVLKIHVPDIRTAITDILLLAHLADYHTLLELETGEILPLLEAVSAIPAPLPHQNPHQVCVRGKWKKRGTIAWQAFSRAASTYPYQWRWEPEQATPLLHLIGALYREADAWEIEAVELSHAPFVFSGRDLQLLRREASSTVPIISPSGTYALNDLLPAGYVSGYTRNPADATASLWKTVSPEPYRALVQAAAARAASIPHGGAPRVAAILTTDGQILTAHNHPIAGALVPSCAETLALHQAKLHQKTVTAMLLWIADEQHHLLHGTHAAPCGFCRANLQASCAPETPVLIWQGEGGMVMTTAASLLPRTTTQSSTHGTLTIWDEAGQASRASTPFAAHGDEDYPPLLPQLFSQQGKRITRFSLEDAGVLSGYLRKSLWGVGVEHLQE